MEISPDPKTPELSAPNPLAETVGPKCYAMTIFTNKWKEVRNFYVEILSANLIAESQDRYVELDVAGIPLVIRKTEHGEPVSYFHLYISLSDREPALAELRKRGVIVTHVGPYTNFRDPEGRVIKLSEEKQTP